MARWMMGRRLWIMLSLIPLLGNFVGLLGWRMRFCIRMGLGGRLSWLGLWMWKGFWARIRKNIWWICWGSVSGIWTIRERITRPVWSDINFSICTIPKIRTKIRRSKNWSTRLMELRVGRDWIPRLTLARLLLLGRDMKVKYRLWKKSPYF